MATEVAHKPSPRRSYHSPLRARRAVETRTTILDTARRMFESNGWAATGMREVAAEAGVATETLYAYFASKRALFQAVADVAVVGDNAPVAVAERPEFVALGRGRHAVRTAAAARLLTEIHGRTAGLFKVLREASANDDELAQMLAATWERQRQDVAAGVALIIGRAPTAIERDGVWAISSPDVYLLLIEQSGWTIAQYEAWIADTLRRLLPAQPRGRSTT